IKKLAGCAAEVDHTIAYSNIDQLTASGGDGYNVFTLDDNYDTGLLAATNGFTLKGIGGKDTLKTSIDANITVSGGTSPTVLIGTRTLTFTTNDYPEIVNFKPATAGTYTYTFTN